MGLFTHKHRHDPELYVTLSVAELLDLHSGGKATQSHLKTEQLKLKHQFEHRKLLKDEQRKEHEDQMKL